MPAGVSEIRSALVQVDDHTRAVGVVGQGAREVLEVLQGDVLVQGVADGVLERVQLLRGARTAGSNRTWQEGAKFNGRVGAFWFRGSTALLS